MSETIIQLNEEAMKVELGEMVRQSVEATLNTLLDEEADRLTNASRYERSEGRVDTRAGSYKRKLLTKAGEVELKVPRLRTIPFETAIIERYRRRESSVEEALVEMYLAGVSVRRVEDITEALWGTRVSAGTVSKLNQKVYGRIEEWRSRPLLMSYPYVYLDGIYLKRNWGGSYENVAILVAMAVNSDGQREVIGAAEGMKEDKESWLNFLIGLKARGLTGTQLFIGDKCLDFWKRSTPVYLTRSTSVVRSLLSECIQWCRVRQPKSGAMLKRFMPRKTTAALLISQVRLRRKLCENEITGKAAEGGKRRRGDLCYMDFHESIVNRGGGGGISHAIGATES